MLCLWSLNPSVQSRELFVFVVSTNHELRSDGSDRPQVPELQKKLVVSVLIRHNRIGTFISQFEFSQVFESLLAFYKTTILFVRHIH